MSFKSAAAWFDRNAGLIVLPFNALGAVAFAMDGSWAGVSWCFIAGVWSASAWGYERRARKAERVLRAICGADRFTVTTGNLRTTWEPDYEIIEQPGKDA